MMLFRENGTDSLLLAVMRLLRGFPGNAPTLTLPLAGEGTRLCISALVVPTRFCW
jgi:hypothetical protein